MYVRAVVVSTAHTISESCAEVGIVADIVGLFSMVFNVYGE